LAQKRRPTRTTPPSFQILPPSVQQQGCRTPKTEILLRFDQNVKYKRLVGEYPLRHFDKICRFCTSFRFALAVKIWLDLIEGLWSYGGFKLRVFGSPNFQCPLAADLCVTPQKFYRCKNVLQLLYHHAKFGGTRISSAARVAKTLSFLSVCLFVCSSSF